MAKLKLGPIADEKPVKLTIELTAAVHRDLVAYAQALGGEMSQVVEPAQLVAPMLARFMAADRAFAHVRRDRGKALTSATPASARPNTAPMPPRDPPGMG